MISVVDNVGKISVLLTFSEQVAVLILVALNFDYSGCAFFRVLMLQRCDNTKCCTGIKWDNRVSPLYRNTNSTLLIYAIIDLTLLGILNFYNMNNKFDALKDDDSGSGSEEAKESALSTFKDVTPGPGEHPLQYTYCFWYSKKPPGRSQDPTSFEKNMKIIGTFRSVEQFWKIYTHMIRPSDLTGHSDIHVFKGGIKPLWEDKENRLGGKWIVRLRKGLVARCWENLILAMLGEQFMVGDEICGAVVSIRFQEDIISIWNRSANDNQVTSRIRDTLRRVLNLPPNTVMEYKTHNESLKDKSSFRNTEAFTR